jgi:threonine-phosphate decarboxylase
MRVSHGGNHYDYDRDLIDFSANINPLGPPEGFFTSLVGDLEGARLYPDVHYRRERTLVAERYGLDGASIVFGNGAIQLIHELFEFLGPRRWWLPAPAFVEYERAALRHGRAHAFYSLEESQGYQYALESLFERVEEGDVLLLCHPNNPTGALVPMAPLETYLTEHPGVTVVIDESFGDFLEASNQFLSWVTRFDNLVVVRSLTKYYALAGLRVGFLATGDRDLLEAFGEHQAPWSLSYPAARALELLGDRSFDRMTRIWLEKERTRLERELRTLGFTVYPGYANYLTFHDPKQRDLKAQLVEKGFLIRDLSAYRGMRKGHYRIACLDEKTNGKLLTALKELDDSKGC